MVIITADQKEDKLIFSEKGHSEKEESVDTAQTYKAGDVLEGEVTGIVDFGIFVKIGDTLEGLVHISELDWGLVEDTHTMYKVGDKVKVKVIDVKDGKVSLSIKQLLANPWQEAETKYQKNQVVEGVVIKYNRYGALVSIEEGVSGLVHVSDFENEADLKQTISLGSQHKFKIMLFEPKEQRMALSYKATNS